MWGNRPVEHNQISRAIDTPWQAASAGHAILAGSMYCRPPVESGIAPRVGGSSGLFGFFNHGTGQLYRVALTVDVVRGLS